MRTAHEVIIRPVITENTMAGIQMRKYVFKVANNANKIEIAGAVQKLFGVKVDSVNTMHVRGKKKRVGGHVGYKPNWKKAIVTLTTDSKGIEFFESMM